MSNSSRSPTQSSQSTSFPRAIIHKRILETAESHPSASLEEISNQVSGATPDFVDRVLTDYGDPADAAASADLQDDTEDEPGTNKSSLDERADTASDGANSEDDEERNLGSNPLSSAAPDPKELTQKQHDTLEAIADHPQATQRDLAKVLDVTPSTVNYRLNSISEFEWTNRREFVQIALSDGGERLDIAPMESGPDKVMLETERGSKDGLVPMVGIEELREQIKSLEKLIESNNQPANRASPALVHRILRACIESEHVTEDDERWIIETFMTTDAESD